MANKSAKYKTNKIRIDLSKLPLSIHKQSSYWYMDTKTGQRIHVSQLHKHLPLVPEQDLVGKGRWDLKYD